MKLKTLATLSICLASIAHAEDKAQVTSIMRGNFEALMNLQPYIVDQKTFSDPANHDVIQRNLDALSALKHDFPMDGANQEPGLAAISKLFAEYLQDVQKAFRAGASGSFVRNQVRTITGFCLSCHTRVGASKSFEDIGKRVAAADLTRFQRAEFYAATRQFDKALAAFDEVITQTPAGELGLIEFGRAIRHVLSITIRVKQDPKATYYFLEKISTRDDIPEYFRRYIAQWKLDARQWMSEKKNPKATPEQLIAKARALVDKAAKQQLFAADPASDVNFLRATSAIHEALQKQPKGQFRGEALYLLGACYDALQDPLLWALDSLYFEACIREFPHTDISKKCYKRYATKLYFGYSGSGGTYIPQDELDKLTSLRKLSE